MVAERECPLGTISYMHALWPQNTRKSKGQRGQPVDTLAIAAWTSSLDADTPRAIYLSPMVDEVPGELHDICSVLWAEFSGNWEYVPYEDARTEKVPLGKKKSHFFKSDGTMAQMFAFNDLDVPKVSSIQRNCGHAKKQARHGGLWSVPEC